IRLMPRVSTGSATRTTRHRVRRPRRRDSLAAPRFTLHASRFRRCALVALLAAAFALVPLPAGGARAAEPALPTGHVGRHGDRPDALGRARAAEPTLLTGVLGEAAYRIQVPPDWNGTLV